jgi:hypothetical protein
VENKMEIKHHVVKMWYISFLPDLRVSKYAIVSHSNLMAMKVHGQFKATLQAEDLWHLSSILGKDKRCILSVTPGTGLGPSQHHILWVPRSIPSGKADHSPRFRTQVKNDGSYKRLFFIHLLMHN